MHTRTISALCHALAGYLCLTAGAFAGPMPDCSGRAGATEPQLQGGPSFTWTAGPAAQEALQAPPFSMAVWGDSLTSASHFVDAVLDAWGIPKNTVRSSFVQAGMKVPGLALPLRAWCASAGWKTAYAYKEKTGAGTFSKGLVSMSSDSPGDTLFLDFRGRVEAPGLAGLDILYGKRRPDSSLVLAVSVDGGQEEMISLSRTSATTLHIKPDAPMSTIRMRVVTGQVTVHGVEPLHAKAPAAVVDSLSIPGATLRGWSNAGEPHLRPGLGQFPDYRLILVQYGTNEGAGRFERQEYLAYLRANLGQLRRFYPQSRCILIGPPDRGVRGSAGPPGSLKYASIHRQIALAQQQVGKEFRCESWDWQAAMGGMGAAARWAAMREPQMQQDLTHLSAKGYGVSGRMFAEAFPLKK